MYSTTAKIEEGQEMKTVVLLTGYAQVGKDTFAKRLVEAHGFTRVSFADPMREALYTLNPSINVAEVYETDAPRDCTKFLIARGSPIAIPLRIIIDHFGWDRAKVLFPEIRQLLQRFGTEVGREMFGETFWIDLALNKIKTVPTDCLVITDARFDNEITHVRYRTFPHYRCHVVEIIRPGVGSVNSHKSDAGITEQLITYCVLNDGTVEDLNAQADKFLSVVGLIKKERKAA